MAKLWNAAACLSLLLASLGTTATLSRADAIELPEVPREFRAAWVATVANIDWPSKPGLTTKQQQAELIAILDRAAELNLNAIIFQVRPHCDALYDSKLEPWSEYLTGTQGKAPDPYYDPLEFIIDEAHQRGLELHAWFNPYRASHPQGKSKFSDNHISKTKPNATKKYGKYYWLDPSDADASEHSLNVMLDVVRRYDVDGIHFDDYFYPYPEKGADGKVMDFPDDESWALAQKNGETASREDWRRKSVNELLERVSTRSKGLKPWVRFGVSPFGIWRPGYPESIKGFDAYSVLYADARHWFTSGIVDYLTPQLYWKIDKKGQSYPVLLEWWHEQNLKDRHLWPGNFTSRVKSPENGNWPVEEILQQVEITREQPGATGNVHFSMKALMNDKIGMASALAEGPYKDPALVPASSWLGESGPKQPEVTVQGKEVQFSLTGENGATLWVLQIKTADGWQTKILPGHHQSYRLLEEPAEIVAISAVDRIGNQGPAKVIQLEGP